MKTQIAACVVVLTFAMAGNANAFCLEATSFCNDLEINLTGVTAGGDFEIYGHEYGCGQPNRQVSGTASLVGTVLHIGLTGTYNSSQVAAIQIPLDLNTLAGTGTFVFVSDAYLNTSADVTVVACPASGAAPVSTDPDVSGE